MPRLAPMHDDVSSAPDVFARALAVHQRRLAAYHRQATQAPLAEQQSAAEAPPAPVWKTVNQEIARQLGIPANQIRKDGDGRGQPLPRAASSQRL
ncbi:MAG TPA: hypothetical protein VKC66_03030 [Xanthobacteraceae bacterium]|nr:hypothetical protein [Xanthobacteraceae bacterium]